MEYLRQLKEKYAAIVHKVEVLEEEIKLLKKERNGLVVLVIVLLTLIIVLYLIK